MAAWRDVLSLTSVDKRESPMRRYAAFGSTRRALLFPTFVRAFSRLSLASLAVSRCRPSSFVDASDVWIRIQSAASLGRSASRLAPRFRTHSIQLHDYHICVRSRSNTTMANRCRLLWRVWWFVVLERSKSTVTARRRRSTACPHVSPKVGPAPSLSRFGKSSRAGPKSSRAVRLGEPSPVEARAGMKKKVAV